VLLWLLPPLALMGGGLALWAYSWRREARGSGAESLLKLTPEEEARLEKLLASDPPARPGEPRS
jgi:cytochrome c-type biogenesis protein CcmH